MRRPAGVTVDEWPVVELAAEGSSVKEIAANLGLKKYVVIEILSIPSAVKILTEHRQRRSRYVLERLSDLVEDALDFAREVLTDPKRSDAAKIAVMDSILDRSGFARQMKVEGGPAVPTLVVPGIEKLSIEQLIALAQGTAQGMRSEPVAVAIDAEAHPVAEGEESR